MHRRETSHRGNQPRVEPLWSVFGLAWFLILSGAVGAGSVTAEHRVVDTKSCLRCHRMATLGYRDPETGKIVDLSIEPEALAHSVHGKLACSDCHDADYDSYPHPKRLKGEALSCVGCHEDKADAAERLERFKTIEREFEHSVHVATGAPEAAGFNCHSCHDPHAFRNSEVGEDIAQIVRNDNAICLFCHAEVDDPLRDPHTWLPKREKHRESVRCLDCHTPLSGDGETVSHRILAGKDSNRDCVNCHSKAPQLLNRLYQYRSETNLASKGWLSKAVFNEAYVVGMSRSPWIDRLALGIVGVTVLLLAAHGYGRYRAYRRSREDRA